MTQLSDYKAAISSVWAPYISQRSCNLATLFKCQPLHILPSINEPTNSMKQSHFLRCCKLLGWSRHPHFIETWRFISTFTTAHQWTIPNARWIRSTYSHPISL